MRKIALTGTHGVGKTFIVDGVVDYLTNEGYTVKKMPSITRVLKKLGYAINNDDNSSAWETQIVCGVLRQLIETAENEDVDFLVADRWIFDELVYTFYFLSKPGVATPELEAAYTLLLKFVNETVSDWDKIYYKPSHPDFLPESDGHREEDIKFQSDIESYFNLMIDSSVVDVVPLHKDRERALESIISDLAVGEI